jgi:hypothetical protein
MRREMHSHEGLGDESGYSWPPTLDLARRFTTYKRPNLLDQLPRGKGRTSHCGEENEPALIPEGMAATLNAVVEDIKRIQHEARIDGNTLLPRWAMMRNWEWGATHE